MSVNPTAFRRLVREIRQLQTEPPEGIRISTEEENILDVTGIIQGPDGTPYEGGYFRVKFKFTEEFPAAPPKCWFTTKIFHPNVSKAGDICVNTLKKDWKREYGIAHILVTVKCLLIYPNPESALDEAAGKLLLENYEDYCKHARMYTSTRPAEFDIPSVIPDSTPSTAKTGSSTLPAKQVTPAAAAVVTRASPPPSNPTTTPTRHTTPAPTPFSSLNSNSGPPPATTPPVKPLSKAGGNTNAPVTQPMILEPTSKGANDQNVDPVATSGNNKANMMDTSGDPAKPIATTMKSGPLKRSGGAAGGGAEKRKKGLKRL
ncbi:hypothetical protein FRB99_003063 [Tulasnella sp. 403]|nr:hypothetical protein FRB99_003063 [Tulasnella sp. 403]